MLALAFSAYMLYRNSSEPETGPTPSAVRSSGPVVYVLTTPHAAASALRKSFGNARAVPAVPHADSSPASRTNANNPAARASSGPANVSLPSKAPLAANPSAPTNVPVQVATAAPQSATFPPVVREQPEEPPQILAVSLSSSVVHGGESVSGTVETSSNVASVEARVAGHSAGLQKVGVGRFAVTYTVPHVPFFLRKTYMVQIIARTAAGISVSTAVPITVH